MRFFFLSFLYVGFVLVNMGGVGMSVGCGGDTQKGTAGGDDGGDDGGGDGGGDGSAAAAAVAGVVGDYDLTLSDEETTCSVSFLPGGDEAHEELSIEQSAEDETEMTATLTLETTEFDLTGSFEEDLTSFTLEGNDEQTFDSCNFAEEKTLEFEADPLGCVSFVKVLTKISGDCNTFMGSGSTSCTASFACNAAENDDEI